MVAIAVNQATGDLSNTLVPKSSGTKTWVTLKLSGEQFVRSFVQHVLPRGFQKVRYYGFMSPNCKLQLADARWLVWLWRGWAYWIGSQASARTPTPFPSLCCRDCGGALELLVVTDGNGVILHKAAATQRGPPCAV